MADIKALFTEIENLLEEAGIEPSETDLRQIAEAIRQLATEEIQSRVPTIISEHLAATRGQGEVQQNSGNKLYVPDVGDMSNLTTTSKTTLTEAINEVKQITENNFSRIRTTAPDKPAAGDIWLEYVP